VKLIIDPARPAIQDISESDGVAHVLSDDHVVMKVIYDMWETFSEVDQIKINSVINHKNNTTAENVELVQEFIRRIQACVDRMETKP